MGRHPSRRGFAFVVLLTAALVAPPSYAQSLSNDPIAVASANDAIVMPSVQFDTVQTPGGAPATPRHTGVRAMVRGFFGDITRLPSKENLYWAATGGALALAAHPGDDYVNEHVAGNSGADSLFRPGSYLGGVVPIIASGSLYAYGRIKDQPKVSHVGMDLIRAQAISQLLTQSIKYSVRRMRPDGTTRNSFPSGHAATTFAVATAIERHLGWRYATPAYVFASYVATSRLPSGRHWLSDVVFGAAVGIISGRTVTNDEANPYPVAVTAVPGGAAVMFTLPHHR